MSDQVLRVETPHMKGSVVEGWQRTLASQFDDWNVNYPLVIDGDYGVASRSAAATVLYGLGIDRTEMEDGITPALRIKVRNKDLSSAERERYNLRDDWRQRLREKHEGGDHVAPILAKIITSSWGWRGAKIHDGVDLICNANAPIFALCDARVIDVRASGWWGKTPSGDVSKGDGIIQIACTTDVGPFKRGMHFGYGHAEHAQVRRGELVKAGTVLGKAGFAVAWHIHFMANKGDTEKGRGDQDPMPFVDYGMKR